MKELSQLVAKPKGCERFMVFPNADNLKFWKVLLIGPPESSYNFGVYMLQIRFSDRYPFSPPNVKFVTSIYHCNVSESGTLCLDILRNKWSPA